MPVEIPTRLQKRPVYSGYPVPYLVMWEGDKPDFRVTDMEKWTEVVSKNLCSLCGQPNDYWLYFIGGTVSISETRLFFDPPTHHECAVYAMKVCPYLATPRDRSERPVKLAGGKVETNDNIQQIEKPDKFGLGKTRGYTVVVVDGRPLLKAAPWASVTWWKDGEVIGV